MSRRVAVVLAAASIAVLAGCDGAVGAKMTFDDTERAKITDIVLTGGSGDVLVNATSSGETRIKREIRGATGDVPSYQLTGSVLTLPTECGNNCQVSYEVTAPAGVIVRGDLRSGTVGLTDVGKVDLKLTSGDVMVENATGPVAVRATSGNVSVTGAPSADLELTSGDVLAMEIGGPVTARSTSGNMTVELSAAASVTAAVTSGDLNVMVPDGAYRLRTHSGSGDEMVAGVRHDPTAANTLDLRARSGDLTVTAR